MPSSFCEQGEADTEDVFGRANYVATVNAAYGLPEKYRLPTDRPSGAPERCVKEVEDAFRLLPPAVPEFDHYRPSAYLAENPKFVKKLPDLDAALDRFEAMFKQLNALLPKT